MRVAIPGSWTARLSLGGLLALAAMQLGHPPREAGVAEPDPLRPADAGVPI